ncbi:MAG TPA: molybdopterin cofactor-binding domain-containing protein, partial [bacterium]|nr:molybdopterin cofactor-binding domain-containing protein [bacterium]
MSAATTVSRREFLQKAGVIGAGLVIAIRIPAAARDGLVELANASSAPFAPNAWLRIGTDDSVLVMVGQSEMGQGVSTALPMLVAEELEADWSKVRVEFAPADSAYDNPIFGSRGTGGSTSVRGLFTPLRQAG